MDRQKSFRNEAKTLYLVATPIGNLEDMTFRAVKILKDVDYIYCEDKRVSAKLLSHFEISKPLKSYHDFNKEMKSEELIALLKDGNNVALMSRGQRKRLKSQISKFASKEMLEERGKAMKQSSKDERKA